MASRKKAARIVILTLFFCALPAFAQRPTGQIEGLVICNDGNVPARGAKVELVPPAALLPPARSSGPPPASPSTTTDFFGAYTFSSVPPGTYIVNATMPGYTDEMQLVRATLDRDTPDQQKSVLATFPQITIKPGGSAHQDLILRRAGAISGTVSVDSGGTVPRSTVTATLLPDDSSSTGANPAAAQFSQYATTDDRGAYRIPGLPPGNYRVSVRLVESFLDITPTATGSSNFIVAPARAGVAELTVFSPQTLTPADAQPVKLVDGEEANNVDIAVPTRLLHSISGIITRAGLPSGYVNLSLEVAGKAVRPEGITMPDGSYRFDLLPDGTYTIKARMQGLGKPLLAIFSVLVEGSDVTVPVVDLPARPPAP